MKQKAMPFGPPVIDVIRDIRLVARRHFTVEEKIRIVLDNFPSMGGSLDLVVFYEILCNRRDLS